MGQIGASGESSIEHAERCIKLKYWQSENFKWDSTLTLKLKSALGSLGKS